MLCILRIHKKLWCVQDNVSYQSDVHLLLCLLKTLYLLLLWTPLKTEKKKRGLLWWLSVKESTCQYRGHGFDPWSRKIPHAKRWLNPCTTAIEPVHPRAMLCSKRNHRITKPGTPTGALYQPRGVGWGGKWEGSSRGRGYLYPYGRFMLMFDRK